METVTRFVPFTNVMVTRFCAPVAMIQMGASRLTSVSHMMWVRNYFNAVSHFQCRWFGNIVCLCGFKAQQCLGQRFGLKTLSTTGKPPFLHEVWSPASSASFGDSNSRPPYSRPHALTTRLYICLTKSHKILIHLECPMPTHDYNGCPVVTNEPCGEDQWQCPSWHDEWVRKNKWKPYTTKILLYLMVY